jgi:cellulose synthase/poly-beta-1,6-N-acetylglucosamine synthase-like glycosyltransferase
MTDVSWHIANALMILYALSLGVITVFSLLHLRLLVYAWRYAPPLVAPTHTPHEPFVTIQLPIFNERYVAERLLDAISQMDYPKEKFEIQLLDDSTDETSGILSDAAHRLSEQGFSVHHLRRTNREGFKAGALQNGLHHARGEFIAIFDADFVPSPNFLRDTLPHFAGSKIGMVQTRWEHLNAAESLLTRAQALTLDAHFFIEQQGRAQGEMFINFNGTAGVWRKAAIDEAGGWHSDTLTEDLDLSYRAQLAGWKLLYLNTPASPAELPADMIAFRSQQFRWTKGAMETARKHLASIWASRLPFQVKLHSAQHLSANVVFVFILLSGMVSVPLLFFKHRHAEVNYFFSTMSFSLVSFFTMLAVFGSTIFRRTSDDLNEKIKKVFTAFPAFLSLSMGMSFHNTVAVVEGLAGKRSAFSRTPKFSRLTRRTRRHSAYRVQTMAERRVFIVIVECSLAVYFLFGAALSVYLGELSMLPFYVMFFSGFAAVSVPVLFNS